MKEIIPVNYEPEWIHYPWIDSLSDYDQRFWLADAPVYKEHYGVFVYNIDSFAPGGYLIEKIDLENGQVMWSDYFFSKEKYSRKVVKTVTLFQDNIELIILEESKSSINNRYPVWDSAYIAKEIYDFDSGEKIESLYTNHFDSLNTTIKKQFFLYNNTVIRSTDTGYNFFNSEWDVSNDTVRSELFISRKLNFEGHILETDTLVLTFPYFTGTLKDNYSIGIDKVVCHISRPKAAVPSNTPINTILISDFSFSSWDTIQYTDIFNDGDLIYQAISYSDENNFIVTLENTFDLVEKHIQKHYLFDYERNLLDSVELNYRFNERNERTICTDYTSDNKLIGTGEYIEFERDSTHHIYVWKSKANAQIDTLLDIYFEGNDLELYPVRNGITPQDDLLLFYHQRQPSYPPENPIFFPPDWYFLMKINGEDLRLKSNNENTEIESNPLIFPNPTSDLIFINQNKYVNKIVIFNADGKVIKIDNNPSAAIDVKDFVSGQYWIQIFFEHSVSVLPFSKQ